MQQFILEEQLDVICRDNEEVVELEKQEFIQVMLKLHQANTYVQYVEDFKFWVMAAGNAHRLPAKEIVKIFVSGLKPDIFREEIYSRSFETLVDIMAETRHELSNYRDIIEISERIKSPEVNKESKDRMPEPLYPGNQ